MVEMVFKVQGREAWATLSASRTPGHPLTMQDEMQPRTRSSLHPSKPAGESSCMGHMYGRMRARKTRVVAAHLLRAPFWPGFLRSRLRGSRFIKPARFKGGRSVASRPCSAVAIPCRTASAWR